MLTITIKPRSDRIPIEAECVVPDRLSELSNAEIERLPVYLGNRETLLGELFTVAGDGSDGRIELHGDWSTVKMVGSGMSKGTLHVLGDVGMHLGAEMTGGEITVEGNAGDWVGAEMAGGFIQVKGSAGHLVGGAYRGSPTGMRGGTILVHGKAGSEIAGGMRRGFVAIGGSCGDFAGVSMTAGTLMVFGRPGIRFGAGMKRGSICLFGLEGKTPALLPTFRYCCEYRPDFLQLYFNQLRRRGFPLDDYLNEGTFHRYNGDLLELGKGEVLAWTR